MFRESWIMNNLSVHVGNNMVSSAIRKNTRTNEFFADYRNSMSPKTSAYLNPVYTVTFWARHGKFWERLLQYIYRGARHG